MVTVEPLALPVADLGSVGAWDAQLVHDGERWLVAFVSARRFFSFHPALAAGRDLDDLTLLGAARDRVFCEGPTLARLADGWRLLASDGPRGVPRTAARLPVLRPRDGEVGRLDATYPTNLPWPTVVPHDGGWLMVGFDGSTYGGGWSTTAATAPSSCSAPLSGVGRSPVRVSPRRPGPRSAAS